jgi:glutamine amidotransferase
MCRLFAVKAKKPVRVHRAFQALQRQAVEHKDGWGIARFDTNPPHLEVNVTPAYLCARFRALGEALATTALMTHLRLASVGAVSEQNAHPFLARGWAFMHNGTVANFKQHREKIASFVAPHHLAQVRGETDSEMCFALFRTFLDDVPSPDIGDVRRALAQVIKLVSSIADPGAETASAMNLMVSNGEHVVATRRGRTLFVTSDDGVRFVASERLWEDGHWFEIPENGIVSIDAHLDITHSTIANV